MSIRRFPSQVYPSSPYPPYPPEPPPYPIPSLYPHPSSLHPTPTSYLLPPPPYPYPSLPRSYMVKKFCQLQDYNGQLIYASDRQRAEVCIDLVCVMQIKQIVWL